MASFEDSSHEGSGGLIFHIFLFLLGGFHANEGANNFVINMPVLHHPGFLGLIRTCNQSCEIIVKFNHIKMLDNNAFPLCPVVLQFVEEFNL